MHNSFCNLYIHCTIGTCKEIMLKNIGDHEECIKVVVNKIKLNLNMTSSMNS